MPRWTSEQLKRKQQRNPHLQVVGAGLPMGSQCTGSEAEEGGCKSPLCPKLERHASSRRVGKEKAQGEDSGRFLVRVTRVGKLLDDDNLCIKIVTDLCRYSGVIPDDCPGKTKVEAAQRTPEEGEEPHTEIEVYRLNASPSNVVSEDK